MLFNDLIQWLSANINALVLFGLAGQALFMGRFLAQWLYSEKAKRSVIPEIFWYLSFAGGSVLLAYAIIRADPVFIIGQATGLFIYTRNLIFIWRDRKKRRSQSHEQVFAELLAKAEDLHKRHSTSAPITHSQRRAAAEALQILSHKD